MLKSLACLAMLALFQLSAAAQTTPTPPSALPPPAPPPSAPPPAPCADSGGLLPGSGLCRDDALARLPRAGPESWTPANGCDTAAQETPLSDGRWLLYAAQRCGERTARLFIMSAENGALVLGYGETTRNRALIGRKVLTLVEGHRAPHEAIFALVLAGLAPTQARRCVLRTPGIQGYPVDAYIFDLPAAESRKTAALDAPCGPYGRSARADSYWRMFDGVGVFYRFSGDRPEFDPGSLLVYRPRR